MLVVDNLCFSYGKKEVLKNISFEVSSGELVSILGPNGSGKTTLLKSINRILQPHRGILLLEGRNINSMTRKEVGMKIGYIPQTSIPVPWTVFEALLLGRKPYITWNVSKRDMEITEKILKLLELEGYEMRLTSELSGGEFQKVVIGRALVQEPKLLLLDEPLNHLDIKNQVEIMAKITRITKELGIATLNVMHDLNMAARFSDTILMLKNGEVFAMGPSSEVMTPKNIREVYGVEVTVRTDNGYPYIHVLHPYC